MKKLIIFLVCLGSVQIFAATKPEVSNLNFKIVDGDLTSQFMVIKKNKEAEIEFSNSLGRRATKVIKLKDFQFLEKEVGSYKGQNSKQFCSRHYMEFGSPKNTHIGCIGSPTPVAVKMTQTAALLSLLF
ncbi:MAG: hypothetical protein ACXVAX_05305 [Pseudobdellovibrio sp.]